MNRGETGLCLSERWESRRAIPGMSCLCPQTQTLLLQEDPAPELGAAICCCSRSLEGAG